MYPWCQDNHCYDTQHNNTQDNCTQRNNKNTQHNNKLIPTQHNDTLLYNIETTVFSMTTLDAIYAECRFFIGMLSTVMLSVVAQYQLAILAFKDLIFASWVV